MVYVSVMQSPMDTVVPDFSADIFQVRLRPQQPEDTTIRCQDSQKNQMSIVRMERKYDSMLKKVKLLISSDVMQINEILLPLSVLLSPVL